MGTPTLPSALRRFTSEFGMGSGGSILLLSPSNLVLRADLYHQPSSSVEIDLYFEFGFLCICIYFEYSINTHNRLLLVLTKKSLLSCIVKPHG